MGTVKTAAAADVGDDDAAVAVDDAVAVAVDDAG